MDTIQITKEEAITAYGGNQAALARALGVTRQAVHAIPDGLMPEKHALKLRYVLKPDIFSVPANDDVEEQGSDIARTGTDVPVAKSGDAERGSVHAADPAPVAGVGA